MGVFSRSVRRIARVALVAGVLVCTGGIAAPLGASQAAAPPAQPAYRVTAGGQWLYEYEALVYHMFGPTVSECLHIGTVPCRYRWLYSGARTPIADYQRFTYAFTDFGPSLLHAMPVWFAFASNIPFGPLESAVVIDGHYVACNTASTMFLVASTSVGDGNLDCIEPLPA